jgi:hypothetical protein
MSDVEIFGSVMLLLYFFVVCGLLGFCLGINHQPKSAVGSGAQAGSDGRQNWVQLMGISSTPVRPASAGLDSPPVATGP